MTSGILSDRAILAAVTQGDIEIDPFDHAGVKSERRGQLQTGSYDLTLGDGVAVYDRWVHTLREETADRVKDGSALSPLNRELDIKEEPTVTRFTIDKNVGWLLKPGIGYLMHTRERVHTKKFIPVLDGRSSIGRLFISVHATAGYGDAGFDGQYTLEVTVQHSIRVYADMRIAQMRFHTMVGEPLRLYDGNYRGEASRGPVASRACKMFR